MFFQHIGGYACPHIGGVAYIAQVLKSYGGGEKAGGGKVAQAVKKAYARQHIGFGFGGVGNIGNHFQLLLRR